MNHTPTPSLRKRVVATVVVLFAVLLVVVGFSVDVVLGQQLRRDLDARLTDRADRAVELVESGVGSEDLVQALQGDAIRVRVTTSDGTVYGVPGGEARSRDDRPGPATPPPGPSDAPAPPGPPNPLPHPRIHWRSPSHYRTDQRSRCWVTPRPSPMFGSNCDFSWWSPEP